MLGIVKNAERSHGVGSLPGMVKDGSGLTVHEGQGTLLADL